MTQDAKAAFAAMVEEARKGIDSKSLQMCVTTMAAIRHKLDELDKMIAELPRIVASPTDNPHGHSKAQVEHAASAQCHETLERIASTLEQALPLIAMVGAATEAQRMFGRKKPLDG
jgi:hypothetical protein